MNNPQYLIVHHTGGTDAQPLADSSNFSFAACNELHRQKWNFKSSLNFYIGYHGYIEKDGKLYQGRADTDRGAHTVGYNDKSLGICLAGNFDGFMPTAAQVATLKKWLMEKSQQYGIPSENIVPHRTFAQKTCYGRKLAGDWARNLLQLSGPVADEALREKLLAQIAALQAEILQLQAQLPH